MVDDVLQGYNGTVMAYGQTGAGKTYTLGNTTPSAIGMIPRCVAEIFKQVGPNGFPAMPSMFSQRDQKLAGIAVTACPESPCAPPPVQAAADPFHVYTVSMSYIQIYMELIQDLLHPESENLVGMAGSCGSLGVQHVQGNMMAMWHATAGGQQRGVGERCRACILTKWLDLHAMLAGHP